MPLCFLDPRSTRLPSAWFSWAPLHFLELRIRSLVLRAIISRRRDILLTPRLSPGPCIELVVCRRISSSAAVLFSVLQDYPASAVLSFRWLTSPFGYSSDLFRARLAGLVYRRALGVCFHEMSASIVSGARVIGGVPFLKGGEVERDCIRAQTRWALATIDDMLDSMQNNTGHGSGQDKRVDSTNQPTTTAEWIRWGMDLERTQEMIHAYVKSHREHPLQNTWETICSLRDDLNNELDTFRTHQVVLFPSLTLSSLDPDSPEDATLQFPSQISRGRGAVPIDPTAIDHEIQLRCAQANSQILAVQDKTVTMSIIRSSRSFDYRGQGGITRAKRSKEQGEMLLDLEITIYNIAREALVRLGYMAADALKPFPPMKCSDTSRKDTHLFRMRGDSRVIGADSWRLLSGNSDTTMLLEDISGHAGAPEASESESDSDELSPPAAGVQTRKRAGPSHRSPVKQRKTTSGAKSRVKVQKERTDGWIWSSDALMIPGETNKNVAAFKAESERVQFFRAEAEFFRWLEQYECKHIELFRVIERFRRDAEVWRKRAEQMASKKLKNPANQGAVIYARTQAAMWGRLRDRAAETFRSAESGANSHWVTATSFEGLVEKIVASRDELLSWMDDLGMARAYKLW
ncbi:hypothetical protein C8F01DRAFT_1369562 [Mycena amicta]|nr:hypothetical protein C8F01DRAFT_1369562 [Mycena amicta]